MTVRGRFITFEGIDGAGKSSHIAWFAQRLRERGRSVLETREPGGTELAEAIRGWLLNQAMSSRVETLLAFAARQDHLDRVIRPALAQGQWVVCDRFTDSTLAYQGGGRGVARKDLEVLVQWVHADLSPDRTYLFDIEAQVAAQRRQASRAADRFEAEALAFFERVRASYLAEARAAPGRFVCIDGNQRLEEVKVKLEESLLSLDT